MKKRVIFFVSVFLLAALNWSMAWAEPPVQLSHSMTGYAKGTDSVRIGFALHVINPGKNPIYNLRLSIVPVSLLIVEDVALNIGDINSKGALDIPFTVIVPNPVNITEVSSQTVFWSGTYADSKGKIVEFPAESIPYDAGGIQ